MPFNFWHRCQQAVLGVLLVQPRLFRPVRNEPAKNLG